MTPTHTKTQAEDVDLELFARELPQSGLSLEALPNEYSYVSASTASSVGTFSSGFCSSFGTIGSAFTLSE